MKISVALLFFYCLIFQFGAIAQPTFLAKEVNPKNRIAFNLLGLSPCIGLSYERFLKPKLSVELGLGGNFWNHFDTSWSTGIGFKWYPFYKLENAVSIYTGLSSVFYQYTTSQKYFIHYLPIGITVYNLEGLHIGINLGPAYFNRVGKSSFKSDSFIEEDLKWYGGLTIGLRF